MNLTYLRDSAYTRVCSSMRLRSPQAKALGEFHKVLKSIDKKIDSCSHKELNRKFREAFPLWDFQSPCPEITYHLATGVGKTRLIGATMAYLFLAGESNHFVIVTPRSEIIRKFLKECQPSDPKYIFTDRNLVGEPEIIDAETAVSFEPERRYLPGFGELIIWVLTPQSLAVTNSKLKRKSDHAEKSPVEFLKSLNDLVIFFDESHHLGPKEEAESSAWRKEIRALNAKFIFGTTASIGNGENHNVIFSYDIKKCLNERLYTKMVRVIAEKKDSDMSDEDHDRMVLRYAIDRLKIKQVALVNYQKSIKNENALKPIMLVICKTKEHADEVYSYLNDIQDFRESVLLVHSGLGQSKYLGALLDLEQKHNEIRIVVNVSMLTEGWDVSNVFVIVPLRAMASSTLVTQVMGRGLRLPYGEQVGDPEVDTLDILCFGRETMQEICDSIIQQGFGEKVINVEPLVPIKKEELIPSKEFNLEKTGILNNIRLTNIRMKLDLLDLKSINIPHLNASDMRAFKIHDPETIESLKGHPGFDRGTFIDLIVTGLPKRCSYLSYQLHYEAARSLVDRFLISSRFVDSVIPLEPEPVIYHIKKKLDDIHKTLPVQYIADSGAKIIHLDGIKIFVPGTFKAPIDSASLDSHSWKRSIHKGIPICGWKRSAFKAIPFDQPNELLIAKVIDRSPKIKWWFRNLPNIITLATPAGQYSPDFAILIKKQDETILLEVKGEVFAVGEDAEANIKKNAAKKWCHAMSLASGLKWTYWLLLDRDAARCQDFDDIQYFTEEPEEILS